MTRTTPRHVGSALLILAVAVSLSGCCGTFGGTSAKDDRAAQEKRLRSELARKKAEEKQLAAAVAAVERGEYAVVALKPRDVENAVKKALPLSFPAKRLDSRVSGTIEIQKWQKVKADGDKIVFEMVGRGRKIKVKAPSYAQGMVKPYKRAVEGGMNGRVSGTLGVDKKGRLTFSGKVRQMTLKKEKGKANDIKKALNDSFFNRPHAVEVGEFRPAGAPGMRLKAAIVQDGNVYLVFAP